ncbi:uncharacterized protein LOC142169863 [Nicotiana tabacum]|uniref:Uncharacterized protein LOC142169863 n=1 Tax=Nicotiana tabacum TaxID=4097 RepID=A0AC58SSE3_TOBAC
MSNLSKLEFVALDISEKNYVSWVLDAEIHLAAKALENTIIQGNKISCQDKAKAMIFLRHHLDKELKTEYLTLKEPFELWSSLKEQYDHLKATILPRARYEWIHLQLQDFKTILLSHNQIMSTVNENNQQEGRSPPIPSPQESSCHSREGTPERSTSHTNEHGDEQTIEQDALK